MPGSPSRNDRIGVSYPAGVAEVKDMTKVIPAWNPGQKLTWVSGNVEVYGMGKVVKFHSIATTSLGAIVVRLMPECGNKGCEKQGWCGAIKPERLKAYRGEEVEK